MWKITQLNNKPEICNNNKILKYCPIKTKNNKLVIQKKWFEKQSMIFRENIYKKFHHCTLENFDFPNEDIEENNLFGQFLKNYVEFFDFTNYGYLLFDDSDIIIYDIEPNEINNLLEISIKFKDEDRLFTEKDLIQIHPNLLQVFEEAIEKFGICFVKTSFKSGKKSKYGIFPASTTVDIINNLIHSTDVIFSLLRDNISLVFRKWNYNIKKENEFRLFVFDGKLQNISQQYPSIHMKQSYDQIFIDKILIFWEKINKKISKLYQHDYTIDVFIDNNEIFLIEINSGGLWSTCASGLFDYNNMEPFEMRYVL
jgi:hypothetical protein